MNVGPERRRRLPNHTFWWLLLRTKEKNEKTVAKHRGTLGTWEFSRRAPQFWLLFNGRSPNSKDVNTVDEIASGTN